MGGCVVGGSVGAGVGVGAVVFVFVWVWVVGGSVCVGWWPSSANRGHDKRCVRYVAGVVGI